MSNAQLGLLPARLLASAEQTISPTAIPLRIFDRARAKMCQGSSHSPSKPSDSRPCRTGRGKHSTAPNRSERVTQVGRRLPAARDPTGNTCFRCGRPQLPREQGIDRAISPPRPRERLPRSATAVRTPCRPPSRACPRGIGLGTAAQPRSRDRWGRPERSCCRRRARRNDGRRIPHAVRHW